jgi:hypothetical protein
MSQKQITQAEYSEMRGYSLGVAKDVGLAAACVHQQLVFWSGRSKKDWFYKSTIELADELPLSKDTIDRSITKLKVGGYLEVKLKKANGAPTRHIRLVFSKLSKSISAKQVKPGFQQNAEIYNNKEPINNNNKQVGGSENDNRIRTPYVEARVGGVGACNVESGAQPTDSQLQNGAAVEEKPTDRPPSLLNRKPSATSDNNESVEQVVDASAKQINGRLTNQPNDVITKLQEIFGTDIDETLVEQALEEVDATTLKRTARWFSKQALESTEPFWAERRHWNDAKIFMTPNSKGTKYYTYYAPRAMAAPRYKEDLTPAERMWGPTTPRKSMF